MKKQLVLGACALMVAGMASAVTLHTQTDKVSYTIGYDMGKGFSKQSVPVNQTALNAGLTAGLKGATPAISEKEMHATMLAFQKEMMKKAMAKQMAMAKKNAAASDAYIAKVSKESGVKQLEKGLYYKVIKQGHGQVPKATDTVVVNYKGTLSDGKVFDSSYKRGQPATFKVNQVIPGWTKALQHMPVGSTWELYIAPKLAYGKFAPPTIGPNQALTFKVQLLSIKKAAPAKKK